MLIACYQAQARGGYYRLSEDRTSLLPYLRSDNSIRPPFTTTQICEAAILREASVIYAAAEDDAKRLYDRGTPVGGADSGNWVIRWLLWYLLLNGDDEGKHEPSSAHPSGRRLSVTQWIPRK